MITFRRRTHRALDTFDIAALRGACAATFYAQEGTYRLYRAVDALADRADAADDLDLIMGTRSVVGRLVTATYRASGAALAVHRRTQNLHDRTVAVYVRFMLDNGYAEALATGTILVTR